MSSRASTSILKVVEIIILMYREQVKIEITGEAIKLDLGLIIGSERQLILSYENLMKK